MKDQTRHKVLILGGGYAGLMAAARGSKSGAEVTLIDARPSFFQRIRFHEMLAGGNPKTLEYAPLLARRGVRLWERPATASPTTSAPGFPSPSWAGGWKAWAKIPPPSRSWPTTSRPLFW